MKKTSEYKKKAIVSMVIQLLCFIIMFTHTIKLCVKVCVSFATRCKSACIAEREGFEPPVPLSTSVFKTGAIDHSAISPKVRPQGFEPWTH